MICDRLIDLKDGCWEKGTLNREGIENFAIEVYRYEKRGYDVRLYGVVAGILFKMQERQNRH